jgi:hypothetical protein
MVKDLIPAVLGYHRQNTTLGINRVGRVAAYTMGTGLITRNTRHPTSIRTTLYFAVHPQIAATPLTA